MAKDTDDRKTEGEEADIGLDMSQTAVKKMIAEARARGYITYDQLNTVLPPDQVSSEQIEDVMSMLAKWASTSSRTRKPRTTASRRARPRWSKPPPAAKWPSPRRDRKARPHRRPGAHVPARDGVGRTAEPRGRDRHRQADRGRAQHDDRGPLRKPADLPGDHDLARRTSRRGHPAARRDRPRRHLRPSMGEDDDEPVVAPVANSNAEPSRRPRTSRSSTPTATPSPRMTTMTRTIRPT
jgi:hypothetical protein